MFRITILIFFFFFCKFFFDFFFVHWIFFLRFFFLRFFFFANWLFGIRILIFSVWQIFFFCEFNFFLRIEFFFANWFFFLNWIFIFFLGILPSPTQPTLQAHPVNVQVPWLLQLFGQRPFHLQKKKDLEKKIKKNIDKISIIVKVSYLSNLLFQSHFQLFQNKFPFLLVNKQLPSCNLQPLLSCFPP